MAFHLIVRNPFDGYEKGTHISDADKVTAILADHRHEHVIKIADTAIPTDSPEANH